tara:strand:- start:503 stop:943 length:441 start_codon:yes stop_codon:yes gene_type:complete
MGVFKFYKKSNNDDDGTSSSSSEPVNKTNSDDNNNAVEPTNEANNSSTSNVIDSRTYYEKESEKLGFRKLAKNLSQSLVSWNKAGRPIVNTVQWDYRISICRQCEFWQEVGKTQIARCKKCGCSSGKLLLATSSCPLNPPKWKAYK